MNERNMALANAVSAPSVVAAKPAGATWSLKASLEATWKFLFSGENRTPPVALPRQEVDLALFHDLSDDQLNVTWLGHSFLMINIDGFRILTDPVLQSRVTPVGPVRFPGHIETKDLSFGLIDVVIISHDHYDHLNKYAIRSLVDKVGMFIVPKGVGKQLRRWGVARTKIVELGWWQSYGADCRYRITATPSQHFSGRGLTDRNESLWASWVIETANRKIFFSGDNGYFDGFRQIGAAYGPFDMTFIECGAYDPAWSEVHMFPEQTLQAHHELRGEVLHPIHWGTYNLALHSWDEPMRRLTAAAEQTEAVVATPRPGEATVLDGSKPSRNWWKIPSRRWWENMPPATV